MPDSRSLALALMLGRAHGALMDWLVAGLHGRGHGGITASALDFLGQLDCGVNHASSVARALGVSRQMVAKTVTDLARKGWLEQQPDPEKRNRKIILFTAEGERVMSDARALLAELDARLDATLGPLWSDRLNTDLGALMASLEGDAGGADEV